MPYKYDTRHVQHGNDYGIFIPIDSDCSSGELTYGCAYEYTGLISTSFETTQDSTAYYADNVEHINLRGIATTSGSLTVYQIRKEFMTGPLGKTFIEASNAYLDTGTPTNFVWIYKETVTNSCGEEYPLWHIYTNCQANAPTGSSTTDGTSATPKEITIPITCSPNSSVLDPNGNAVTVIDVVDKDLSFKAKIDNLFDADGNCPGTETMQDIFDYLLSTTTPSNGLTAPVASTTSDGTALPVISWTSVDNASSYNIYRAVTGGTLELLASNVTSPYTDSSAVSGTTYDYAVTAVDSSNNESDKSNTLTIAYNPASTLSAPVLSDATVTSSTAPELSWGAVSGATSYTVYRGETSGSETSLATNLTSTTYEDDAALAGVTYFYTVTATDSSGESPQSNEVSIVAPGLSSYPTNIVATASTTTGEIDLTWDAVQGATGYNIYQTDSSTDSSPLSTSAIATDVSGTSYSVTGLTTGTTYYFTVSTVNANGEGTQSGLTAGVAAP